MTLENFIAGSSISDTHITLDERFKIALKLAQSVLFLHTAGFVHKNVTSPSIESRQRYTKTHDMYSLEVILLEIGHWEQLSEVLLDIDEDSRSD
ncbi:hypothetical protein ACHAPE_008547 [Trichoderma viride]